MPPRSISPASTADQKAEHRQKEPDHAATPPPPPPPRKDRYATLAGILAPMDAEQYYQSIQRDLPADHATLQWWKQEKRSDNEWGTEEDLLWDDTWKGTMDAFLEPAAETYPRQPGNTRHGLHALLAFHSWKHRHTITLHPVDHNPHRWTPEDDATAAIPQNPENPEECHITWNDQAPHPPASPTLSDVFATISAELQEAKAPQQTNDEMPQAPSSPTTQESPRTELLTHPITTMELPPQPRTNPDRNGFRNLPQERAVHNGTLRWDEITPGLQAIRLHSITEPATTWTHTNGPPPPPPHHPRGCHHHTNGGRPHNSSPQPRRPHTPASIVHTYDGTSGPHPMASHRHHLPHPQRPHTHLAAIVGGHTWGPPPGTPRAHVRPPHPPPGMRSRPSTTRHTHPGAMGVRHTQKPTSSGGHQDRAIHPASQDPEPTATANEATPFGGHTKTMTPSPPKQPPPPLYTNTTALFQGAAAAATQVGAPETWSPQYLVETKVAPHAKAQEKPPSPKPLHPPLKLDTMDHTPHDESATHYIMPHTTTRKNDAAKITITRHLPHTTQVYELKAPNVVVTHCRHDERYTIQAEGAAATTLYTWTTRADLPHPTLHHAPSWPTPSHTADRPNKKPKHTGVHTPAQEAQHRYDARRKARALHDDHTIPRISAPPARVSDATHNCTITGIITHCLNPAASRADTVLISEGRSHTRAVAHLDNIQPHKLQRAVGPFAVHITPYGIDHPRCEHHDPPCSTPCTSPLRQPLSAPTITGNMYLGTVRGDPGI